MKRLPFCAQKGSRWLLIIALLLLLALPLAAALAEGGRPPDIGLSGQADTPTPTPTETATPTSTPTAPKPSGPLLESILEASWWLPSSGNATPVAVYQPLGATSQAASYTDLSGNGYHITTGVEPTWASATGWTFNGTNHLITGVIPNSDYSVLVRFSDGIAGARALFGTAVGMVWLIYYDYNKGSAYLVNVGTLTTTPALGGVFGMAGKTGYYNGSALGSTGGAFGTATGGIYLGAYNNGGTPNARYIGKIQLVAIYSNTLNATDVAEISGNMAAVTDATATPTNTATATPTETPAVTPTPSPTPAPGLYTVELPSGNTATVEASATAGQLLAAIALGSITLIVLFGELKTIANLVANK